MQPSEQILQLVQQALEELDSPSGKLSSVIRKCIRIARLRNDFENLLWLEKEMRPFGDKEIRRKLLLEIAVHYAKEEFKALNDKVIASYMHERQAREYDEHAGTLVDSDQICSLSVSEIEEQVSYLHNEANTLHPPSGLLPIDLAYFEQQYSHTRTLLNARVNDFNKILRRIEYRVHEFLSTTEKQLIYSQINADIFERNRRYVEEQLKTIAPEAFDQFISAHKRVSESKDDPEAKNQALLSCRRILKTLADSLYPPPKDPVVGADGKVRTLDEEKYIARLWQFVHDKLKDSASGEVLITQLQDLGNRVDSLYVLSCKGIHGEVSDFEVSQCVVQTYITIGDIIRVAENKSAADSDDLRTLLKE